MVTNIILQGEKNGFSTIEVFREKEDCREFERYNGHTFFHDRKNYHVAVRVFRDFGAPVGFHLSNPSEKTIHRAYSQIGVVNLPDQKPNYANFLPESVQKVKTNIFDPAIESIESRAFTQLLSRIDEHLRNFSDLSVSRIRMQKVLKKVYITNTKGLQGKYKKSQYNLVLKLVHGDNSVAINENRIYFAQIDPERMISRGSNLLHSLTDQPDSDIKTRYLILAPEASAQVIKEFAHHFKLQGRKRSSHILFSSVLNIADDPNLDGQSGSVIFDDEGVQSPGKHIIEKGVFSGTISNVETAFLNKQMSSGNGYRHSSSPFPQVQFSNIFIKPTVLSVDNLMKEAGEGILVSLVKVKQIVRDGIVFSAYGYRFHGVDRQQPVHFYLKTSFLSYFMKVLKVSKELRFFHSQFNIGSPYLLVEGRYRSLPVFEI